MKTILILMLGIALSTPAHAQPPSLREAFEQAWSRTRQGDAQAARADELDARERVTDAWFPDSPTVGLDLRRDLPRWVEPFGMQQGPERGKNEWEPSIAMPLWLPGQRDAQRRIVNTDRTALAARATSSRLQVAGEVRESLWAAHRARSVRMLAESRRMTAEALETDVARRVRAGDLARTDLLLAQADLLAARAAVAAAAADERATLGAYATLVGAAALAADVPEAVADAPTLDANPTVVASLRAIEAARIRLDYVQTVRRDNPTVGIVPRFDRDVYGGDYRNTVRVGIAIPLDTEVRNAPRIAAASAELSEAQVAAVAVRKQVQNDLQRAQAALEGARAQQAIAAAQLEVARENLELIERAFRLGERGVVDVLRVRAIAREAALAAEAARLDLGLAAARLNQAYGVLP
ncbi:MAG: TolC family protein [Anaerolineae bacterium]|jgi:outer membrane protein TolC|nr:TolC family protein [Anaerolineae bacterium]